MIHANMLKISIAIIFLLFVCYNMGMSKQMQNILNYSVVIEKDEKSGYFAYVPNLPGCYTQGGTIEKTIENAKEAIGLYLEVLQEEKQKIPYQSYVGLVNVAVPFRSPVYA